MPRPVVRVLIAAAVTTGALVAVPQAAFANIPGQDGSSGAVHVGALVAPSTTAASDVPLVPVATFHRAPTRHTPAAKSKTPTAAPSAAPSSSPTPARTTAPTTGSDVSYPQCPATPPANQLFAVIGVNGGTAKDFNPCLLPQFAWASTTAGATPQGTVSLYVNTANPGRQSSWWPTSDSDQPDVDPTVAGPQDRLPATPVTYPYGGAPGCSPTVDPYGAACSYVYGYVRAEQAVEYARETLGDDYSGTLRWWLDVETSNTWAGPATANAASLAGAATYLGRVGQAADGVGRVGVYSSTAQYRAIMGGTGSAVPKLPDGSPSPLVGLPEWGAGASSLAGAQSNCGVTPFTGGTITLTQFVSGAFDYDVSCRGY